MSFDPETTRTVRSWLDEGVTQLPDRVLDAVLDEVPATPQRRARWPAGRTNRLTTYEKVTAGAAAVLAVAIATASGIQMFEPDVTPASSPTLIARGSFVEHDWGRVQFEATRRGSSVTGRMTVATRNDIGPITVNLQCTRETEDGLVMIGGYSTSPTEWVGEPVWVIIQRGNPKVGMVATSFGNPSADTTDCLANMDAWLHSFRMTLPNVPIPYDVHAGSVEFGP